jgi:hypothetical protein
LHLILEKKKIQITIEEQMLKPPFLCFSPVSGRRSIVHGPSSIVNFQPKRSGATFNHRQLILEKENSKNKPNQIPSPWSNAVTRLRSPIHTSRSPAVGLPGVIQGPVGDPQSEIISQKSKISSA